VGTILRFGEWMHVNLHYTAPHGWKLCSEQHKRRGSECGGNGVKLCFFRPRNQLSTFNLEPLKAEPSPPHTQPQYQPSPVWILSQGLVEQTDMQGLILSLLDPRFLTDRTLGYLSQVVSAYSGRTATFPFPSEGIKQRKPQ
jgi:hypothetical protein